jgi:hypothetical protein
MLIVAGLGQWYDQIISWFVAEYYYLANNEIEIYRLLSTVLGSLTITQSLLNIMMY